MQTEATIQQKAMQDIFALEEAVGQFESFGNQLDLGLPAEEDDSTKSFDDMLEVNPSNEPMEYGENFMSEGDDLQDKQTQKFVVDEFAKEAAKLPDGTISEADITGISAIIQMNNHLTGDLRSFIDQTINHAVQAQQQQNVSDAQPNGTVAQDLAKTGDNAEDSLGVGTDALGAEPGVDGGIPTMDPIDPTAEPSLDANPSDGLGLDDGLGQDVGDPLAGMDGNLGTEDPMAGIDGDVSADAGVEGEDPLAGMDDGLGGTEPDAGATDDLGGEGDAGLTSADDDLDNFLDSEDDKSTDSGDTAQTEDKTDDKPADDDAEKSDDKGGSEDDNDDDFNFEAIATKARGLLEGSDAPVDDTVVDSAQSQGADAASADVGGDVPAADVGGDDASTDDSEFECEFAKKEAKVESIVQDARMKMAVSQAKAVIESYHKTCDRASTLAKLDSVVRDLKHKVLTESIINNFAKKSKKRAQIESAVNKIYNETEAKPSVFESTMNRINEALSKTTVSQEADKIIAEFEASQKTEPKPVTESVSAPQVDPAQSRIDSLLDSVASKESVADKLNAILEGVKQSQAAKAATDNIDKQLNNIVNQIKNF